MKNRFILIFSLLLFIGSCKNRNSDQKEIIVTDFSKKRIDTIKPEKGKSYYSYYVKVKGNVNDSIRIQRKGYYDLILTGNIDTLFSGDYYGGKEVIWIFDPYKADKGELKIEYGL